MRVAEVFSISLTLVLTIGSSSGGEAPEASSNADKLVLARQTGWQAATAIVENLAAAKQPVFPGINAWLDDFDKQTKGLDPTADPKKWPKIDIDALVTDNPRFWRAYYEIAPGDPGAILLHAGLLLGCGEADRASSILELQQFRPGVPEDVRKVFGALLAAAKTARTKSNSLVEAGIVLFDKGDYDGANKKYREAVGIWPQNGWAYYEMAYTLHTQNEIAAGERPPRAGEGPVVRANSDVKVMLSPEVKALHAKSRRHAPLMPMAYQGDDPEVIRGLLAFKDDIMPALKSLRRVREPAAVDQALGQLAKGCQEASIHEFALVTRQILVARRGRYDASDHPFLTTSLQKLAPGPETEAALERLAGREIAFRLPERSQISSGSSGEM